MRVTETLLATHMTIHEACWGDRKDWLINICNTRPYEKALLRPVSSCIMDVMHVYPIHSLARPCLRLVLSRTTQPDGRIDAHSPDRAESQ